MDTEARVTKGSRDTGGVVHVGVCGLTWCLTYKKKGSCYTEKEQRSGQCEEGGKKQTNRKTTGRTEVKTR